VPLTFIKTYNYNMLMRIRPHSDFCPVFPPDNWTVARDVAVPVTLVQARVTRLLPAQSYHIRVLANNSVSASEPSASLAITTQEATPTASPMHVDVTPASSTELSVSWIAPPKEVTQRRTEWGIQGVSNMAAGYSPCGWLSLE
jgi:hypothetical protein